MHTEESDSREAVRVHGSEAAAVDSDGILRGLLSVYRAGAACFYIDLTLSYVMLTPISGKL